jgi:hypothetical protein
MSENGGAFFLLSLQNRTLATTATFRQFSSYNHTPSSRVFDVGSDGIDAEAEEEPTREDEVGGAQSA